MLKSWPLCNGAEPNFADSFAEAEENSFIAFARQRGAKWACASKIVSFQPGGFGEEFYINALRVELQ